VKLGDGKGHKDVGEKKEDSRHMLVQITCLCDGLAHVGTQQATTQHIPARRGQAGREEKGKDQRLKKKWREVWGEKLSHFFLHSFSFICAVHGRAV